MINKMCPLLVIKKSVLWKGGPFQKKYKIGCPLRNIFHTVKDVVGAHFLDGSVLSNKYFHLIFFELHAPPSETREIVYRYYIAPLHGNL